MKNLKGLLIAAVAVVGLAFAVPANAVVFNLDDCHFSSGCGGAGTVYGTVTLTQNGTTVDVTVALNSAAFVQTGAGAFQDFLFNATGVVAGDITIDAHTPALALATGPLASGPTGTWAFGINCPTCGNGAQGAFSTDIVFHVANATIADLTTTTSSGGGHTNHIFAADLLFNGATGVVASQGPSTTPEPASLLLLGAGLAGIGIWRRKA